MNKISIEKATYKFNGGTQAEYYSILWNGKRFHTPCKTVYEALCSLANYRDNYVRENMREVSNKLGKNPLLSWEWAKQKKEEIFKQIKPIDDFLERIGFYRVHKEVSQLIEEVLK